MISIDTLICLTKNLVYKNIEVQIWGKIRTIIRTLSASKRGNIIIFILF